MEDRIIEPIGRFKDKVRKHVVDRALDLSVELMEKSEPEKRKCKHPNHPTYYVNKQGKCKKAWKCPDRGKKGCLTK